MFLTTWLVSHMDAVNRENCEMDCNKAENILTVFKIRTWFPRSPALALRWHAGQFSPSEGTATTASIFLLSFASGLATAKPS